MVSPTSSSSTPPPPPSSSPSSPPPPPPQTSAALSSTVSSAPNLDPTLYKEYISTRTLRTHTLALSSTSPSSSSSTPIYTISTHASLSRQKPSIVFHEGGDKTGKVVGVVKIWRPHGRHYTVGVGDPGAVIGGGAGGENMVWEDLQRMKKWTYRAYSFEFGGYAGGGTGGGGGGGGGGHQGQERGVYTWRRTIDGWGKKLKNMELRVGSEEDGEVVAVWKGRKSLKVKNGSMFVKKKWEGVDGGDDAAKGKWELMVLLTGLSIIEGFKRRQ